MRWSIALLLLCGCGKDEDRGEVTRFYGADVAPGELAPTTGDDGETGPGDTSGGGAPDGSTTPVLGWIGSPCATDADCDYDGAVCLLDAEGFPGGTCSQACDQLCPDEPGYPVTFCVDAAELPADVDALGDGGCLSRCDMSAYPGTGCREGYGCAVVPRANEPWTEQYVCMPGAVTELTPCQLDLAARGVVFSPTIIPDDSPSDAPDLVCHVEEPVIVHSPVLGVELYYVDGGTPTDVEAACDMAHALADTAEDLKAEGAVAIRHIGTRVCRTIAGTSTLSRHSYGDAIDLWGFDLADGTTMTLEDHYEDGDPTPETFEGAFLYDAAWRWHDQGIWNIVLTPDYNDAHDNHFHVDLTPGSDFIGFVGPFYFGPSPYPGE